MKDNDEIICNCLQVTRGEIIEAIKTKGLTLVDEVGDETEAGTGCSSCHGDIEEILKEING